MIVDRDKGLKALLARLARGSQSITVGVHADAGSEANGASVQEIAGYHEFGTDRMPARPFIRGWVDANGALIRETLKRAGAAVVKGLPAEKALLQAGLSFVGGIQTRMSQGIAPEKADGTTARLIDTGHLRSSITAKVATS